MRTRRVRIDAIELSVNEVPGPGRPLVLLHGLTGHRDDFAERMADLAGEAWLLAPDLRGHGDSTHTGRAETYTIQRLVEDLGELLDSWCPESCDLLGHSFGGMIVLRYALAQPLRVASLILMNTSPAAPEGFHVETFRKAGEIARTRGMAFLQALVEERARAAALPGEPQTLKDTEGYWAHHRRRYTAMDPVGYAALALAMVEQTPIAPRLHEIRCPTTILVGDRDVEFQAGADALEAGIPHAVRVTIPNAGHHPHMEDPASWLAAVREHLRRARMT